MCSIQKSFHFSTFAPIHIHSTTSLEFFEFFVFVTCLQNSVFKTLKVLFDKKWNNVLFITYMIPPKYIDKFRVDS